MEEKKGGRKGKGGKGKGEKDWARRVEKMMEQGHKDAEEAWSRVTKEEGMGYKLFKQIWTEKEPDAAEEQMWEVFSGGDMDGDKFLSEQEFHGMVGQMMEQEMEKMKAQMHGDDSDDTDGSNDGRDSDEEHHDRKMWKQMKNNIAEELAKDDDGLEMWMDVLHKMFNKKVKMEVRRQMKRNGCAGGDDSDDSDGSNDGWESDGSDDGDEQPGLKPFKYYWDMAEKYDDSGRKGISYFQFQHEWRKGSPDDDEEMIQQTFGQFDEDGSEMLEKKELKAFYNFVMEQMRQGPQPMLGEDPATWGPEGGMDGPWVGGDEMSWGPEGGMDASMVGGDEMSWGPEGGMDGPWVGGDETSWSPEGGMDGPWVGGDETSWSPEGGDTPWVGGDETSWTPEGMEGGEPNWGPEGTWDPEGAPMSMEGDFSADASMGWNP